MLPSQEKEVRSAPDRLESSTSSVRLRAPRRSKHNAARLHLFATVYNLANFLRQLVLPKPIQGWTLTTLREKLIKVGAKVVSHSRYVIFQPAEVAVPRQLFAAILSRIGRLRLAGASGQGSPVATERWKRRRQRP